VFLSSYGNTVLNQSARVVALCYFLNANNILGKSASRSASDKQKLFLRGAEKEQVLIFFHFYVLARNW